MLGHWAGCSGAAAAWCCLRPPPLECARLLSPPVLQPIPMPVPTPTPLPPQSSRCCSFCRRQPCASSCRAHCRRWPTCYAPACRAPGERPGSAPGPGRGAWGGPLLRLPACLAACRGGPPLTAPLTQPSAVPPAVSQRRCARCAGVHGEAAGAPLPALCVRGPAERWVPRCRCRRRPVPPPLLDGWRQRLRAGRLRAHTPPIPSPRTPPCRSSPPSLQPARPRATRPTCWATRCMR